MAGLVSDPDFRSARTAAGLSGRCTSSGASMVISLFADPCRLARQVKEFFGSAFLACTSGRYRPTVAFLQAEHFLAQQPGYLLRRAIVHEMAISPRAGLGAPFGRVDG